MARYRVERAFYGGNPLTVFPKVACIPGKNDDNAEPNVIFLIQDEGKNGFAGNPN